MILKEIGNKLINYLGSKKIYIWNLPIFLESPDKKERFIAYWWKYQTKYI